MRLMDTTFDSGTTGTDPGSDDAVDPVAALAAADPAEAPRIAEAIADDLAATLEDLGGGLDPEQLHLEERH